MRGYDRVLWGHGFVGVNIRTQGARHSPALIYFLLKQDVGAGQETMRDQYEV